MEERHILKDVRKIRMFEYFKYENPTYFEHLLAKTLRSGTRNVQLLKYNHIV